MDDFLNFRRMITPVLIHVFFLLGIAACIIIALGMFASTGDRLLAIAVLIGGPILLRIVCESLMLFYRINDTLTDISNTLEWMADLTEQSGSASSPLGATAARASVSTALRRRQRPERTAMTGQRNDSVSATDDVE